MAQASTSDGGRASPPVRDRHLYPPPELCYNPDIERTTSLPDDASLNTTARMAAQFPVPAYERQELVFAQAFALLREAIAERAFPAASVAVTHEGKLVALKALGRFTFDAGAPEATPSSIFDLASLTKVLATATMAAILYERGLLDMDLPVASVVPEFIADDVRREEVSFRMLLAHSSGLPAYEKLFLRAQTRDQLLSAAFATPLAADPGSQAEYSDIGFIVLGVALERLAEESLDHFCQHEVFGPLGMLRTAFNPPSSWRSSIPPAADDRSFRQRVIQGEVQDENASVLGGVAGHAGLFATVEDVATFAHAMLQGGRPILRPETLAVFARRESAPSGASRALGWDTPSFPSQAGKYFSAAAFGHLGYTGGSLWIDPQRQLSVTLLTNRTWPDCKNQAIKQVRPRFHDAVIEALEANR
ncbi:MAG: beta-lactamase family protein [Acidobacteriia bacterium]|nr:beta-lactamase family protein [Terriglobia bacterium]